MLDLIRELFPICRSITGDGIRQTLRRISREIGADLHDVPTGSPVFDWTVPQEWTLRRATLCQAANGRVIADTHVCNLHVLNYSLPFRRRVSLEELKNHLHTMPDKPKWIPYRTSYYKPTWGICLADEVAKSLPDVEYDVAVDTEIKDGSLTYGELFIPGKSDREVLFSTHCCHPSLANDNLSGIAVACELAKWLRERDNALGYRFIFIPGTIGSITWLARNVEASTRIVAGLVLSCLGDPGAFTYKRSRRQTTLIDRAVEACLGSSGRIRDFIPYGYDERQFCSPGFNLPVGCLMRTPNGEYAEYHTSADDCSFVRENALRESAEMIQKIVGEVERLHARLDSRPGQKAREGTAIGPGTCYRNLNPFCEPQLGRRGLYALTGGHASVADLQMALLWVLNYSDGRHDIDWISQRSTIDPKIVQHAADLLERANLLAKES